MNSTLASHLAQLIGAWKLNSITLFQVGNEEQTPVTMKTHGEEPFGRIVFTDFGYMTATVTSKPRTQPLKTAVWEEASDEDVLNVARVMTTYSGSYKLSEEEGVLRLTTQVEIALNPNWIGAPQIRDVELYREGDTQYLVLKPLHVLTLPASTLFRG